MQQEPKTGVDRNAANRLIEAIGIEARHAADRACDHLLKDGYRAGDRADLEPTLALAAALRQQEWAEQQLVAPREAPSIPASIADLTAAARGRRSFQRDRSAACGTLAFWIRNFAWTARPRLGVDVRVRGAGSVGGGLVESLADLLWKNRGNSHGNS